MRRVLFLSLALAPVFLAPLVADALSAPKPPAPASLTISAKSNPITFGQATTISGRLKGAGKAGSVVTLQRNPAPYCGYQNVATTTTAKGGSYAFAGVRPNVNTLYRATSQAPAATSTELMVQVRIKVTLHVSDASPSAGRRVRFFGSATPQHDGRTVRVQRQTTSGWKTVARTRLLDAGSRRSRYSRRIRVTRDATYRARVYRDADHATGTSRSQTVDVH